MAVAERIRRPVEDRMSTKNSVSVLIGGKVTRLSGYESEEYLQRVGSYLDKKIAEISELKGYNRMTSEMRGQLLSLNVADDYFKAKKQAESYDEELKAKDQELYELRQKVVELEMELDELTRPSNPSANAASQKRR